MTNWNRLKHKLNAFSFLTLSLLLIRSKEEKTPLSNFPSTARLGAEFLLPALREGFPFLQLVCRWPWGGIDLPRAWEPHILHTSVSYRPPARLCETNSLFSTSRAGSTLWGGALYGITKTMAPYGEQKDLPLAFSTHNKRRGVLCTTAVTLRLQHFSITTDEKGESHFIPV